MKVLYKTLFLLAGALVILLFILPLLRGENPYTLRLERIDEGSSYEFPLGTDQLGRDILARATAGGRNSLLIAFTALSLSLSMGALLGATAAFGPALWERFVTGLTDLFLAVPGLLLALLILGFLEPSPLRIVLILGVISWAPYSRLTHQLLKKEIEEPFVPALKALGLSRSRILRVHLLPPLFPILLAQAPLDMASLILMEAGLGFLGAGLPPPLPSWGSLIEEGRYSIITHPERLLLPCLGLMLLVSFLSLLAERYALKQSSRNLQ